MSSCLNTHYLNLKFKISKWINGFGHLLSSSALCTRIETAHPSWETFVLNMYMYIAFVTLILLMSCPCCSHFYTVLMKDMHGRMSVCKLIWTLRYIYSSDAFVARSVLLTNCTQFSLTCSLPGQSYVNVGHVVQLLSFFANVSQLLVEV